MLSELINKIYKRNNPIKIISKRKNAGCQGFYYERIWDLVIKFDCCDIFPNNEYKHMIGNINNYIETTKIISGNGSGSSDITLFCLENEEWIFITCKYFLDTDKKRSVKKYDIQDIITVIHADPEIYKNFSIYILVNNKENI